jgi:hypothetical protein
MGNLSEVGKRYEFNVEMLTAQTGDFSESDWGLRDDDLNAAHWILAHIVRTRRSILRMLGHELPTDPWEELTALGGPRDGFKSAPAASDLLAEFRDQGSRIKESLQDLSPEVASRPMETNLPDGSKTVGESIAGFFYFHESFHLGQFGFIRRLLGKPGII